LSLSIIVKVEMTDTAVVVLNPYLAKIATEGG
jgi:hypothetical protein